MYRKLKTPLPVSLFRTETGTVMEAPTTHVQMVGYTHLIEEQKLHVNLEFLVQAPGKGPARTYPARAYPARSLTISGETYSKITENPLDITPALIIDFLAEIDFNQVIARAQQQPAP